MKPSVEPCELCFPLPRNPYATLHAHLSFLDGCSMVHLTTTTTGESASSTAPLGSFVYAMPDRLTSRSAISTPICTSGSSVDYATRLSKILAVKMKQPVYVGCSINFSGSTVEEEIDGLTKVVKEIMKAHEARQSSI